MNKTQNRSRSTAEAIVQSWLASGAFPDRMLDGRAETTEIVYGVIRNHRALTWVIKRFVPKTPSRKLIGLLETGLYQLLFMDHADDFAVVHETVESAKAIGGKSVARLVNAVLRRAQRERTDLLNDLTSQPFGIQVSHPDLLIERWTKQFGEERMQQLCDWNNRRSETILRVNAKRTDRDALQLLLRGEGIETEPHPHAPESFITLPRGYAVSALPGFTEGHFYVQDPATSAAVKLLDLKPGQRVFDACAAPGGKAALCAEAIGDEGTLIALELHKDRIGRMKENLKRLGHEEVEVRHGDATEWKGEPFDRILLDVPCSNTGVIRRRPDVRWRFDLKRLEGLCRAQREILAHGLSLLKPGGKLVYSTCSLETEENEDVVKMVLEEQPGFTCLDSVFLFPPETRTDGAFAALIQAG